MLYSGSALWAATGPTPFALSKLKDGQWQRYVVPNVPEGQNHSVSNVSIASNVAYFAIDQGMYRAIGADIQRFGSAPIGFSAILAESNGRVLVTTDSRSYVEISPLQPREVDMVKQVEQLAYPCNSSVLPHVFPSSSPR